MNHPISSLNRRNRRAFIASLLSYILLAGQMTPLVLASNNSATRVAVPHATDAAKENTVEAPKTGAAPVPVRLSSASVLVAPNITATKTDSFADADADGKAEPGETITYTVTISNTGPGATDATNVTLTDTIDPNTSFTGTAVGSPVAFDESYNVIGNVFIHPNAAQGLLANDINTNTGNNTLLTASGGTTSTQGGNVTINSDGSFTYDPPVGYTGPDSFNYTVTSANGSDTGTVSLTVAGMVFFVNDDDATAGGDGRLSNPFNCLVGAGCFSTSTADEAGDNIFLFDGAYTGGLTLLANQKFIGQGASATLQSLAGIATVESYSEPLPTTDGNANDVTITTTAPATSAITLSTGNTLRGFTVGNTTAADIAGAGFGTLTVGNSTTPDVILNGIGQALNLANGTFAATSAFSSVATTGATGAGVLLSQVAGTVGFGSTSVSGHTLQGVRVDSSTADINFGNTSVTGGTNGIDLSSNSSGTRTFGTLSISGGTGNGFLHTSGGGNTTITGAATIGTSTGNGIEILNAPTGTTINFSGGAAVTKTAATVLVSISPVNAGVNITTTAGQSPAVTFESLGIASTLSGGLAATGGPATITVTNGSKAISTTSNAATAAPAIITNSVTLNANFSSTTCNNSLNSGQCVGLTNTNGTSNLGGGTLTGGSGSVFLVNGGGANVTYAGGITQASTGAAVAVSNGHNGTLTFNTGTINATNGTGLQFDNADGTYNFNGTTTLNGGDAGVDILNGSGGTFSFNSNTSINNPTGTAFNVNNSSPGVTYSGNITKSGTSAGRLVDITGQTGGTITFQTGTLSSTSTTGTGIQLSNADGTVNFNGTTTLNGGDAGVDVLAGSGGTFAFGGATITNPTGVAFNVDASSGGISISGGISKNNGGRLIDFNNYDTGTATFSGNLSCTIACDGIEVTNDGASSGTVTFSGATKTLSTVGDTAVNLDNNDGGTINFTGGGLDIDTTSGAGFNAVNGGTVNVTTGANNNTIDTTTGTGLNIAAGTNIGGSGVTFRSIAVSGAPSGIILSGTTGAFTVNGDGSNARNGSGGTLNNTTDDAVRLTNASNVTLRSMNLNSPGDTLQALIEDNEDDTGEHGIEAIGSSNIILSGILIDSPAGSGMIGLNVTGTNRINNNSLITNIDNPATHGLFLRNGSGFNLTLFEVNDTDFTNSSSGASTLNVKNDGTANMTVEVENGCIFEALSSQAVTMDGGGSAGTTGTLTSLVTGNTFRNAVASEPSPGIFITSENNVAALVVNGATHNATISNNLFENVAEDGRVANTSIIRTQNSGGKLTAVVSGNTIQNINYQTGAGGRHVIGHVFEPVAHSAANFSNLRFENNTATNITFTATNREFIFIDYRDTASGGDIRILGNNWNMPTSAATSEAMDLNFTQNNAATVNLEVDNNGNGTGAISNTSTRFLRIDSEDASTLRATVTDNKFTNNNGTPGIAIDFNTSGTAPNMCVNVSNNNVTAAGNQIRLNEGAGTMTVTQASQAAVGTANNGATVTVVGTPLFGQPACTLPSNGPVSFDTSTANAEDTQSDSSAVGGIVTGGTTNRSATGDAQAESSMGGGVTSRPFVSFPAQAQPKAAKPAPLNTTKRGGSNFRNRAEDSVLTLEGAEAVTTRTTAVAAQQDKTTPRTPVSTAGPTTSDTPTPNPPSVNGDTLTFTVGTLPAGASVTITFQVIVDTPYGGPANVSNQGTVTCTECGAGILTDDPTPPANGAADPTLTPIDSLKVFARDAKVGEPASPNTTNMVFTVALSAPATSLVSVNFTTADQTPPGTGKAVTGTCPPGGTGDYTTTSGTVDFDSGQQIKTISVPVCSDADDAEGDETFLLNLTGATGATIQDGEAVGTITANTPGTILISELRTFGPGPGNAATDEFVEIYNNSNSSHTVADGSGILDAQHGYGVYTMASGCDSVPLLVGIIPNGTVIPARSHFLLARPAPDYSLADYGGTGAAAGDLTLLADIPSNANVAIFSTADVTNLSTVTRLDAVGFDLNIGGAICDLLREGTTATAPTVNPTSLGQYSILRDMCGKDGSVGTGGPCPAQGNPKDSNDNASDFFIVNPSGTDAGDGQRIGAAGPENLGSPLRADNAGIGLTVLDSSVPTSAPPNRVREFTSDPGNNSTHGTLAIRRRVTNNTGSNVSRLRFRVIDMTTFSAPAGVADLRARTSGVTSISVNVNDAATCGAKAPPESNPCSVDVQPTTLETPPAQSSGGGFNSTLSVTLGTPLANGASVNVEFLLGVEQTGSFRFILIIEALP